MAALRRSLFVALAVVAAAAGQTVEDPDACPPQAAALLQTKKPEENKETTALADEGSTKRQLIGLHEVEQGEQQATNWFKIIAQSLTSWGSSWANFDSVVQDVWQKFKEYTFFGQAYLQNAFSSILFSYMNFVQGFPEGDAWYNHAWHRLFNSKKWKEPKQGEKMEVITFAEYARRVGQSSLPSFFGKYYTGGKVPSHEDNGNHANGVRLLDAGIGLQRRVFPGQKPTAILMEMEPRFAFDDRALMKSSWDGFPYMGPKEIKYASNGFNGVDVVDRLVEKYSTKGEVLGILMSFSAFGAHLTFDGSRLHLDLSSLEKYTPLPGYAKLGGRAEFVPAGDRLRTVKMEYGGAVYTDFNDPQADADFKQHSKLTGWRFAEKAIIASLLAMTNLVLHVKDLHLELAAAFQAITHDAFASDPKHPLRRLLEPFIHRSVQATNDNFKLLFEYHAAEFSLAPLSSEEQLRLISDFVSSQPLNLADMDMERYGTKRGMDPRWSSEAAQTNDNVWGWRWHYRALKVQRLYKEHVECWLNEHYSGNGVAGDALASAWWASMIKHIPALKRTTETTATRSWASSQLSNNALKNVIPTLMVWLSWIHEDVGHSAAAYVYNPVHTPMHVPADGVGVVAPPYLFNVLAYRGFVFLNRAKLLDSAPEFWFDQEKCTGWWWWRRCTTPKKDKKCFTNFQRSFRSLGSLNTAFSECDKDGFYSCVDRVETAVSS